MDAHWGTFALQKDLAGARQAAANAVSEAGLAVWAADDDGYFVQGGSDTAVVTITLTPTGADIWVTVIANSTNGTAEGLRNLVRELVQGHAPPSFPHL